MVVPRASRHDWMVHCLDHRRCSRMVLMDIVALTLAGGYVFYLVGRTADIVLNLMDRH